MKERKRVKVYIWGTGAIATDYIKKQEIASEDILGYIESKKSKEIFAGKIVYEPEEIVKKGDDYDYILVCIKHGGKEVFQLCNTLGININKLILIDNWEWIDGSSLEKVPKKCCRKIVDNGIEVSSIFPQLYESYMKETEIQAGRYMIISRNGYDLCEKDAPMLSEEFNTMLYQTDYFRYRTFELVANEIIKKEIKGNVAEVGVFRGAFARLINHKFRDRKMYLFDTFESFDEAEFDSELNAGRVPKDFLKGFKNTSVELVLSCMPYPNLCEVKKGLFPETAIGLENERYAFVSIDVDFEKSILEGLRYFYPRLNEGGAIFVHDYNNRFLEGVKKAIYTYEDEVGQALLKVPLADEGGSLVIVK